jgi:thiamine biosynthesis lipoprotein
MQQARLLMGMPITVAVLDAAVTSVDLEQVFASFVAVDEVFSTYKETSEISRINRGELAVQDASRQVQTILRLSEQTRRQTHGYFDIHSQAGLDPSGIVKGWAIRRAASMLRRRGFGHFFIDAGGDIQLAGTRQGQPWRVGIRNPFKRTENVKVLALSERGVATSGSAIRGQHIYNPHQPRAPIREIVSLTVIGPNIYEADRFATAAFAMGQQGIQFIEHLEGFEGYLIDAQARATFTSGFERYVVREP